ncbi:DNA polymerase III subunit gamma/tau [Clostridium thermobutyricum]|uniref:DNA-directed DNA polymerase n=1 Tax=Clostridium thermobutyricum DSM 4928 TaxID=1121339 RepID=A0A1V4SYG4_9CLOT|nr:DNA polymerase III subunit gamma/tau [Clostridium thermobutyricum]OPX49939.1 DNA polymerase III subunit tau [Clostridium thermobutyricum DSM 4928]
MAYTALYREWRPKTFEDVIGQEHITTTLKNQILNDRIAHAYLFCGTRGTGKTSTAKVFAKALNCLNLNEGEPCNECENCKRINEGLLMDVTELDAASNNGVDKIRDIIDDAKYPPQEARFKIYIMDEVHMLSTGAVNAFLKTLEEPPQNVIFILATTDPQKLPITILSRCQRFDFRRISNDEIVSRLRKIVEAKGVFAEDKSLQLISRVSDGAMRDSLSILDQAIAMGDGNVDYSELVAMLGLVTNEYLFQIVSACIERDIEKSMQIIDKIVFAGKDVYLFIKDLIAHYRNLLMVKVTNNPDEVLDMSLENIQLLKEQAERIRVEEIMRCIRIFQECESDAKATKQARLYLELSVIKVCKIQYDTSNEVILARINKLESALKSGKIQVSKVEAETAVTSMQKKVQNAVKEAPKRPIDNTPVDENSTLTVNDVRKAWKDILETFRNRRLMVIYASITTGKITACSGGVITINYDNQYSFNKDRLEKPENNKLVNEVFTEILRSRVRVQFTVDEGEEKVKSTEEVLTDVIGSDFLEIIDE